MRREEREIARDERKQKSDKDREGGKSAQLTDREG